MNPSIIVVEHLSYRYSTGAQAKIALADINIEIAGGSCVALIGVTGSGKTTLVQHFNGLLRPTSGKVIVDGIDVGAQGSDLRVLRQRVGMLFQFPETQLFEHTVYADVAFGPKRMEIGRHEIRARVHGALEMVGLPHKEFAARNPFGLSGGQRRRVALAGILAMSPKILVMDEPTVGLDAEGRDEFYSYLRRVQREQGVTIVLVSHDMTEVAALADMIVVLHNGHLVMQGPPQNIFAESELLHKWGLAAPPLSELLSLLRQRGVAVPLQITTVEEAFAWLASHVYSKDTV